jgi:hypothetical protein
MSLGNAVKSDPLSTVYTTEQYPLGTTYLESADEVAANGSGVTTNTYTLLTGDREWVFIKSDGTIAAGDLVKRTTDGAPFVGQQDNSDEGPKWDMLGVADHAIASGSYSWVIKRGACVVQAVAAVAAGNLLASDGNTTAGEVSIVTGTGASMLAQSILGISLETEAAGAESGAGYVCARIDIPA